MTVFSKFIIVGSAALLTGTTFGMSDTKDSSKDLRELERIQGDHKSNELVAQSNPVEDDLFQGLFKNSEKANKLYEEIDALKRKIKEMQDGDHTAVAKQWIDLLEEGSTIELLPGVKAMEKDDRIVKCTSLEALKNLIDAKKEEKAQKFEEAMENAMETLFDGCNSAHNHHHGHHGNHGLGLLDGLFGDNDHHDFLGGCQPQETYKHEHDCDCSKERSEENDEEDWEDEDNEETEEEETKQEETEGKNLFARMKDSILGNDKPEEKSKSE